MCLQLINWNLYEDMYDYTNSLSVYILGILVIGTPSLKILEFFLCVYMSTCLQLIYWKHICVTLYINSQAEGGSLKL